MNSFRRMQLRWRSWLIGRRLRKNNYPLREFLYLDEVSVYSLLASKSGAIPTDFTDKKTKTWTSELSGTGEATLPIGKLGGGLKGGYVRGSESQVARKAIVQSTFREFREGVKDEILLREPATVVAPPQSVEELIAELGTATAQRCAVRVADLDRGKLFELAVELEADNVFRASSVIEAMAGIVDELPRGLKPEVSEISDVVAISKIMDKLLVGLVPLRCRVIDFVMVSLKGEQWIVHRDLLAAMPTSFIREPIDAVAVTENQLYWKDLRRVVFSKLPVTVLGRIAVPGVRGEWSSMKLGEVMNQFSPDFADAMKVIEKLDLNQTARVSSSHNEGELVPVLTAYANACISSAGAAVDRSAVAEAVEKVAAENRKITDLDFDAQVTQFERFEAALQDAGISAISQLSREEVTLLRSQALAPTKKELVSVNQAPSDSEPNGTSTVGSVECEVVAIYW